MSELLDHALIIALLLILGLLVGQPVVVVGAYLLAAGVFYINDLVEREAD